jgi:hypothetical protein
MSDTTVTTAPPAPAPAQGEVPIPTNQISPSNPVGSQAPPAPEGEHRPIKASLKEAYDRAVNPNAKRPEKPAPRAAEAKAGHNQPPEETPKLNLRKRPDEQQELPLRGERGQFAPRTQQAQVRNPQEQNRNNGQQPPQGQAQQQVRVQSGAFREPPTRIAEHAKREWHMVPESVRGEVKRLYDEFGKAYSFYKKDYEDFKPVKKYHQLAQQHGTTLEKALDNYIGIEEKLRKDPIGGLDTIVNNLGLVDPETGQRLGLRDVAYSVLSQTPEQLRQIQQSNAMQASTAQIGALHQKIERLENESRQMHYNQQFTYTRSAIDQFAVAHPRLDELGDIIEAELKLGFDLPTAYRRADMLRPATRAAQTGNSTPSAQTRTPDRSISGSPDVAPSNGASRRKEPSGSPREAARNAIARFNGHA